jgi:hypothetical protein
MDMHRHNSFARLFVVILLLIHPSPLSSASNWSSNFSPKSFSSSSFTSGLNNFRTDVFEGIRESNNLLGIIIRATTREDDEATVRREGKGGVGGRWWGNGDKSKGKNEGRVEEEQQQAATRGSTNEEQQVQLSPTQIANRELRRRVDERFRDVIDWASREMFVPESGSSPSTLDPSVSWRSKWEDPDSSVGDATTAEPTADPQQLFKLVQPSASIKARFLSVCNTLVYLRWYGSVPCILCHCKMPVRMEDVLGYLGDEGRVREYNEFLGGRDLRKDRGMIAKKGGEEEREAVEQGR